MADWKMERPALRLCERLEASDRGLLPFEILRLDDDTAGIVVEVDGVDYILSMMKVSKQRPRPATA